MYHGSIIFLISEEVTWLYFLSVSNFLSNRSSTATKLVCCQGWTSQMLPLPGPPWQLRGCKKKCGGAHAQNTPSHPHFHIQDLVSQRNWGHKTCTKNMHCICKSVYTLLCIAYRDGGLIHTTELKMESSSFFTHLRKLFFKNTLVILYKHCKQVFFTSLFLLCELEIGMNVCMNFESLL